MVLRDFSLGIGSADTYWRTVHDLIPVTRSCQRSIILVSVFFEKFKIQQKGIFTK